MESEKVYPISEKKLLELRNKGLVPHSKLSARIFTFGVLVLFSSLFKDRIRRVFFMLTNAENENHIDSLSVILTESATTLLLISLLTSLSYIIFSLFETKFLILPYGRYKEGIRKQKNPITIKTELLFGFIFGPLVLLIVAFTVKTGNYSSLLNLKDKLGNSLYIIGTYSVCLSLTLSIINKLKFRLSHKMSKEEIISESLEGQMSPSNRSLIDRASNDL